MAWLLPPDYCRDRSNLWGGEAMRRYLVLSAILITLLAITAPEIAHGCAAHNDASEIIFQHFTGIDPRPLPIDHASLSEAVAKNPAWVNWASGHLSCRPC